MDEEKGNSSEIEEWMKELLPDVADIGQILIPACGGIHSVLQTPIGCHSTSLMVKHQEAFNVLQHTDQTTLPKSFKTHSGLVPECAHPELHLSVFHQSQNLALVDQLKPGNQLQTMHLGPLQALSESTPQVELTNSVDWVNQACHKILLMKEIYLSEVIMLFNRAREGRHRATNAETVIRCEKTRIFTEKILKFLNMSRSDILRWRKEKIYQTMNDVIKYLGRVRASNSLPVKQTQQVEASGIHLEAPQIQQRGNFLQFNSTPASFHQSLKQGALTLPESSVNSFKVGSSAGVHKVDASSMVNSCQYSPMLSTQQWAPQGSVVPSTHKDFHLGFEQGALRMLVHPSDGVAPHNNLGTSQQTATSSKNIFNPLDYSVSSITQTSISVSPPQNKQQDPAMKRQKMKQPVQQLWTEKTKQQMLQKRNEDTKLRHFLGFNQRWSPLLPSSSSPCTISPQNSQQSSSQLELKDLSSKFSKSATPSLSASPSAFPSPLTPLSPSSAPVDSVKSPLCLEESSKLPKTSAAPGQISLQDRNQNQLVTDTQGLLKSCVHTESTCPGDKQSSRANGDPLKHLVEVVKLISSRALNATLRDIDAVTNLTDRIAGHFLNGESTRVVSQDLAGDISNCDNGIFSLVHRTGLQSRMKRQLDTMTLNELTTETEFCASGRVKRLKKEPNELLLQEIKEINQKLIEVVVDVMNMEDVSRAEPDEGTLIRFSYIPIGLSGNIKMPNTSKQMFPILLLELIVTADYPNSSPTVLETTPPGCSDAEEGKYLWMKAKSSFSSSLRKFSQPISLKEMAETWDVCAREVFNEHAEQMGGVRIGKDIQQQKRQMLEDSLKIDDLDG
ncbi:hypothetical protein Pfo_000946 [Paulownia fortunei]|nr:hypothetical protein Pfo_000946 [Paulownia fortunei]